MTLDPDWKDDEDKWPKYKESPQYPPYPICESPPENDDYQEESHKRGCDNNNINKMERHRFYNKIRKSLGTSEFFNYIIEQKLWFNDDIHMFFSPNGRYREKISDEERKKLSEIVKKYSGDLYLASNGGIGNEIEVKWDPDASWEFRAPEIATLVASFSKGKIIFNPNNFYDVRNPELQLKQPKEKFLEEIIENTSKDAKLFLEEAYKIVYV